MNPGIALQVGVVAVLIFLAWLDREALAGVWRRLWWLFVLLPVWWVAMIAMMRLSWPAGGSNSPLHVWPLHGLLAAETVLALWLILRHRDATNFVVAYAIANLLAGAFFWMRYMAWLGSAL
jgi:hypothetical protein